MLTGHCLLDTKTRPNEDENKLTHAIFHKGSPSRPSSESSLFLDLFLPGTPERGRGREQAPLLPFHKGEGGQKFPSLTVFILILATVFQPENTTEGTLCLKLTEIHLITLLSDQYIPSNISNT